MAGADSQGFRLAASQRVGAGRYTLVKLLGQGGMGVVWLARDERLGQDVALKFLPSHIQADPAALDDMRRETARSIRLTHPNIIRIHDLHEIEGQEAFISMEYVDGPTLHALRVAQHDRVFPWGFLQPLLAQLCSSLDYAHAERVIHRDLKPANMMLDARGRLKLADFGIAAVISDSLSRISLRRPTSGTPTHMSPQQMNGQRPRVTDDIYSLGASLYELLTSRPPFYSGDIAHQVLDLPAPPMADRLAELELANQIPPAVAAMVMACLAKEPEQRPQSARAVAEWIGLSLPTDSTPLETPAAPRVAAAAPRAPTRLRPPTWLLGTVGALLVVGIAGWYWEKNSGGRQFGTGMKVQAQGLSASADPGQPAGLVILDEKFEDLDSQGRPKGWAGFDESRPGFKVGIRERQGNHFLQLESTRLDAGTAIWRDLKLDPQWTALRLSFRVRTENVRTNSSQPIACGAFINVLWLGDGETQLKWDGTTQIDRDNDWISVGTEQPWIFQVPDPQARYARIIVQLQRARGTASFDDVKVVALGPKSPAAAAASTVAPGPGPSHCIDLSRYYNVSLTESWHFGIGQSDLSEVPRGIHKFGDVQFDVRGLIQVGATSRANKDYPQLVSGIPVGRPCQALHFLHAAIHVVANADDTRIGSYVVHYADGTRTEIPIRVGREVADWFEQPDETGKPLVVAWQGYNPESRKQGRLIRLFATRWQNPSPDNPITTIDVAHNPAVGMAPFLVALTAEGPVDVAASSSPEAGFAPLFNGRDLSGWSPYEKGRGAWSVRDGLLMCDPTGGTLAWDGTLDNFELRFSYKFNFTQRIAPGDAGFFLHYRRSNDVIPYEAHFNFGGLYALRRGPDRSDLARDGERSVAREVNGKDRVEVIGRLGNPGEFWSETRGSDWTDCVVRVQGTHHVLSINGRTTIDFIDENSTKHAAAGTLDFMVWTNPKQSGFSGLRLRNVRLKRLGQQQAARGDPPWGPIRRRQSGPG